VPQLRRVRSDHAHTVADVQIESTGGLVSQPQGVGRRRIDEVEHGAALQLEGRARMVGGHGDRGVERRVVAPPALPFVLGAEVGPWPVCRVNLRRPMISAPTPVLCRAANALSIPVLSPCPSPASSLQKLWTSTLGGIAHGR